MLPQTNRLNKDKEIKGLVQTGKAFFLPQLVIKYKKVKEKELKIGFVVSTKVDKRAVVRNKLKRQLREIVHKLLLDLESGYHVILIAKSSALELNYTELTKQVIFAFSKIKIYNKE